MRLRNPSAGATYPHAGEAEAVVDTGYSGFVFVPPDVFDGLGLGRPRKGRGTLADGRSIRTRGTFATLELPAQGIKLDGLVQTTRGASAVLLGMDGMRALYLGIDNCAKRAIVETCDEVG